MNVDPPKGHVKPMEVDLPSEVKNQWKWIHLHQGRTSAITSCLLGDITSSTASTPALNFHLGAEISPFTREPQHQLWFGWKKGLMDSMKPHSNSFIRTFIQDWTVSNLKGRYKKNNTLFKKSKTSKCLHFGTFEAALGLLRPLLLSPVPNKFALWGESPAQASGTSSSPGQAEGSAFAQCWAQKAVGAIEQ